MTLYIDTTDREEIILQLLDKKLVKAELIIPAERRQAEELLIGIESLLEQANIKMADLTGIKVNNAGGSFTSLRIGVVTANALAYALGIPIEGNSKKDTKKQGEVQVIAPRYASTPDIIIKKHWSLLKQ